MSLRNDEENIEVVKVSRNSKQTTKLLISKIILGDDWKATMTVFCCRGNSFPKEIILMDTKSSKCDIN